MLVGTYQKRVVRNRGHGYTYSLHSAEVALQESIRTARLVRNQPETQPTAKTLNSSGANPVSLGSGNIRSNICPRVVKPSHRGQSGAVVNQGDYAATNPPYTYQARFSYSLGAALE